MTAELLGQLVYLTLGCLLFSLSAHRPIWPIWLSLGGTVLMVGTALFAARRCGALRLVERVLPRLVRHVSDVPIPAITGLHESVTRLFGDRRAFGTATLLHSVHWALGAAEVWIVLRAMGLPIGPGQAIVMNAAGLAARSAGVAVPGSLVVQESGFMIGAALAGMPPQAALVFSLIRRLREMAVGGIAIALWQWDRSRWWRARPTATATTDAFR
ncbi:MAG: lysylphosphatidylglycerol synthase domain-containing protein [Acetobacteraceae bacterium]